MVTITGWRCQRVRQQRLLNNLKIEGRYKFERSDKFAYGAINNAGSGAGWGSTSRRTDSQRDVGELRVAFS